VDKKREKEKWRRSRGEGSGRTGGQGEERGGEQLGEQKKGPRRNSRVGN
jgi:hypothetical protein